MGRFLATLFMTATLLVAPALSSAFSVVHLWEKEVDARQRALWDPPETPWEQAQETALHEVLGALDASLRAPFMRQFGAVVFQDFTQLVPLIDAYAGFGARMNTLLPQDFQESEVMRLHYCLGAKLVHLPHDQWIPLLEDVRALCNARPDAYVPYIFGATLDFFAGFEQAPRTLMAKLFDLYLCTKDRHIGGNFVQTLYLVPRDVRAKVMGEVYPLLRKVHDHLTDDVSLKSIISDAKIESLAPESQIVLIQVFQDNILNSFR